MAKKIQVSLPVSVFKENNAFVAYSPSLDISTCGDTLGEVKERFAELVGIFFEEMEHKGTTEEVLDSLGWKKVEKSWAAPLEIEHSVESFEVPVRA